MHAKEEEVPEVNEIRKQQMLELRDIFPHFSCWQIINLLKKDSIEQVQNDLADYSLTENNGDPPIAQNIWIQALGDPVSVDSLTIQETLNHVGIKITDRRIKTAIKNVQGLAERNDVILKHARKDRADNTRVTRAEWIKIYGK
jgi:hypothetical protein